MVNLHQRSHEPEWMDGQDVSQAEYAACIKDLAHVNTLTLARRPTLAFIDRALRATPDTHDLTIVDVGYGAGDMLRALARLIARRGRQARLIGFDINPRSEPAARSLTPATDNIDFRTGDAFAMAESEQIDIVISSLVTHHMTNDEIVRFLKWMEQRASIGWFVNDLHRNWLPYHGFRLLAGILHWHPFVRHDGPLSIARAFRRDDWSKLLSAATLGDTAEVQGWIPFRYCVEHAKW